jgi:hypothetical protein
MYPNADANYLTFRVDGLAAGAYTTIYEVRLILAEAQGACDVATFGICSSVKLGP